MVMCLRRYCHGAARDGLFRFGCLLPASTGTSFGCRRGLGVGLTVDMPVAVVAHHIVYDGGDLLLELVDEPGRHRIYGVRCRGASFPRYP